MPKVSIVVPVYNVDKYLKQCLNSILNQSYVDWECIVIDDGSTDLSWKICDTFASKDDRIRVIHQKNQGVSKARNVGIDAAKGEFLVFIDPDDYINEDYLCALINDQKETGVDIVQAEVLPFLDDNRFKAPSEIVTLIAGKIAGKILSNTSVSPLFSKSQIAEILPKMSSNCWGRLFRIGIWEKIRFPESLSWGEDTFTVLEALCEAESISLADKAVYCYRMMRNGSLSQQKMPLEKYDMIAKSWSESCKRIIKSNPYVQNSITRFYKSAIRVLKAHIYNRIEKH